MEFEFVFEDVETLNRMALHAELDIIKLSYAHYFNVLEHYVMLTGGGALGSGVGPLLISKKKLRIHRLTLPVLQSLVFIPLPISCCLLPTLGLSTE
ncbi:1,4-dihydroxy-6-naphtoate synthase [Filimonas sp.]|nr:1,4-dihydroxy-6-naphtoate synthase [Filimonas sp.]